MTKQIVLDASDAAMDVMRAADQSLRNVQATFRNYSAEGPVVMDERNALLARVRELDGATTSKMLRLAHELSNGDYASAIRILSLLSFESARNAKHVLQVRHASHPTAIRFALGPKSAVQMIPLESVA
jgi:hypothetical protein